MQSARTGISSYTGILTGSAHFTRLLRIAWLLAGNAEDAEDVVQTALARAFQHWNRVAVSDDVDAYVRKIVVNAERSRFRRRRPPEVPLHLTTPVSTRETGSTIHDRARLAVALRALPLRQRQVVVLRYIEDLSERDTAVALGCSIGTVKSAASRGLASLRNHPVLLSEQSETRRPEEEVSHDGT